MIGQATDDFAAYAREMETGPPMVHRAPHLSWLRRMEERLRGIYKAITCTSTSDVIPHRAPHRRPRHSSYVQVSDPLPPRHSSYDTRPRVSVDTAPRPPPPDQAGGSSWHHQPQFDVGSLSGVAMRPRQLWHTPIPIGLGMCSFPSFHQYNNKYVYQYDLFHITGESYHDTSSGSGYFGDDGTSDFISQQAYGDIL